MIDGYLTVREVSEKFNVTTGWVSHLCIKGKLSSTKVSGVWFIKDCSEEDFPRACFKNDSTSRECS